MGVQPETQVFLKYARKRECWVCSLCDTENVDNKCHLCGALRQHNSVVKPTWNNMIHAPVRSNPNPNMSYNNFPREDYSSESSGSNKVIGIVAAWIAIVFILLLIIIANS